MWNHAPAMEAKLSEMQLEWPRFEGEEMRDFVEFVRSPANREPALPDASGDPLGCAYGLAQTSAHVCATGVAAY